MRRFTRLTNSFSKKLENHIHMIALYAVFYNFTKIHKTCTGHPGDGCWPDGSRVGHGRHRPATGRGRNACSGGSGKQRHYPELRLADGPRDLRKHFPCHD